MFNRILAPIDGSPLAESILPHVLTFAQAFRADVALVRVADTHTVGGSSLDSAGASVSEESIGIDPLRWQIAKQEANAYLESVQSQLQRSSVTAQTHVLEGRAAERILDFARDTQADLIALSSHGHSGPSDWRVGSVAQRMLTHAPGAKLLVRASTHVDRASLEALEGSKYKRIFVPLDGSWRAESVLPVVAGLAQFCAAEVVAAHVIRAPEMARRTPPTDEDVQLISRVEERNRQETVSYFEQLRSRLTMLTETHVLNGESAAEVLHELADRVQADLVLLSAHGFTGGVQSPYGSVAQSFIWRSAIPVCIVDDAKLHPPAPEHMMTSAPRQHEVPAHA